MSSYLRLLLLTLAAFLGSLFASPEAEAVGWKTAPDDEVRQHGGAYSPAEGKHAKRVGSQHEYAGPEAEWKGEERWVPSGNRAEQFFSETLEDGGKNGPSAREQCRINGWLNYDTTSGCTVAARNTAPRNTNVYEALFEAPISGTTRNAHRASANRNLANQLQNSPDLSNMMNQQLGGNVLQHMQSGRNLLNPPGTVWHHPANNPNAMQLLRRTEHTAPSLQPVLHPGGVGGFGNFYGP